MEETYVRQQQIEQITANAEPQMMEASQTRNEYLETMQQDMRRKTELDNSEWNGILQRKNSSYMDAVKEANNALHEKLQQVIPTDLESFESSLADLESKYETLIQSCNIYLQKRKWAITPSGRARARMVKQTLASAIAEKSRLKESAYDIYRSENFGAGVIWGNTMNETRRTTIRSDSQNERKVGKATVIENGGTVYYFKKETKYLPVSERLEEEIFNNPRFLSEKAKLDRLKPYLKGEQIAVSNVLKTIGGHPDVYTPASVLKNVNNVIKEVDPSASLLEESYGSLLLDICPLFAEIHSSASSMNSAGVEPDRPLEMRKVAASRLAELFGMSDMIAESKTVNRVKTDENGNTVVEKGVATKEITGDTKSELRVKANQTKDKQIEYTPEAVAKLNALRIFDVICGIVDRDESQIRYESEVVDGKVVVNGIKCLGNSSSFGKLTYESITKDAGGIHGLKPLEVNGKSMITYVDTPMAAALLNIKDEDVKKLMGDILSEDEIKALNDRIHGVVKLFDSGKIITVEKWNEQAANTVLKDTEQAQPELFRSVKVQTKKEKK